MLGRRRLLRVTGVCNVVVLLAGVAVAGNDLATRPRVAFEADAPLAAPPTESPPLEPNLPSTGDADLPPASAGARRVDLPHHELDYLPPVVRTGTLDAEPELDGGCAWIEVEGEPQAVRWPEGFAAGFVGADGRENLELLDADGRVVARGGDTIWFTGALSGAPEQLERCHVGGDRVWYVGSVGAGTP